jgi:hypothetical protein
MSENIGEKLLANAREAIESNLRQSAIFALRANQTEVTEENITLYVQDQLKEINSPEKLASVKLDDPAEA